MKKAHELNRLWNRNNSRYRARVIRELTAGGKLNVRLLGLMLDDCNRTAFRALSSAILALT